MVKRFIISSLEVIEIAAVTIGAVWAIRTFLVQPFLVSGLSMVPTFANADYLLIDELSYRFRPPERGEVVVFHYPKDERTYFIKRVIGLPGEKVLIRDGQVTIINAEHPQGFVLSEPYLPAGTKTSGNEELILAADQYVVLGDNRSYSFDSRSWGVLNRQEIVGLARVRLWPLSTLQAFAAPQY